MKGILVRLFGSLVGVLGLWTLVWLPLVLGQTSAAEGEERALGDPRAPVTIIEYASLTCPHCAQFHTDVLPELKERYVANGKVRLVYRHFPLDNGAWAAAAVAECAGPDRYFGFLDVLFEKQQSWAAAPFAELSAPPVQDWIGSWEEGGEVAQPADTEYLSRLRQLGKLGGLSDASLAACLTDQALLDRILQSRLEGDEEHDVQSTPSFVIDGETHAGVRDVDAFAELIDPLLGS